MAMLNNQRVVIYGIPQKDVDVNVNVGKMSSMLLKSTWTWHFYPFLEKAMAAIGLWQISTVSSHMDS